jgi:hypothetical protein
MWYHGDVMGPLVEARRVEVSRQMGGRRRDRRLLPGPIGRARAWAVLPERTPALARIGR